MQPQYNQTPREQRPLQKSMFLTPTEQYVNRTNTPIQYQYQDMMKRSMINPDTNKINPYQYPQSSQMVQYAPNNQQMMAFTSPNMRFKQPTRNSNGQYQLQPQQHNLQSPSTTTLQTTTPPSTIPVQGSTQQQIHELQQKVGQLTQLVESHDELIKRSANLSSQQVQKSTLQPYVQQIQTQLKQSIIPTIISRQTKQIYEHIFDFKLQITQLKEEISKINDKFKDQFVSLINNNSINSKLTNSTSNSIEKIDSSFLEVTNNILDLESRFKDLQRLLNVKNDQVKLFILAELEKTKTQLKSMPPKLKSSTVQSTLTPIMLQYRQVFAFKNPSSGSSALVRRGVSNSHPKEETQILINSTTYYIDKEGYLLDSLNRYIVDSKGNQIKLEEKHLALLKDNNALV